MKTRLIGGKSVGALGLGCMGMSFAYGSPDDPASLVTLARALELWVDHWDTADMYGAGANEKLLAQALEAHGRERVFLATKFGNVVDRTLTSHQDLVASNAGWIVDGIPEYARRCLEASLTRLGTEHADLYYLHRVDDRVPIEETVGAIGLSEVTVETLRKAQAVHPIAAVQNELSLWTRDYETTVLPHCAATGVAFVPTRPSDAAS